MKHKVLIASRSFGSTSQKPFDMLKNANVEYCLIDVSDKNAQFEINEKISSVDAVIVGLIPITAEMIKKAPNLKVISMHGVGVDHINREAAKKFGVIVTNCPGSNDQAVADLAMGLMVTVARNIPKIDKDIRKGEWKKYLGGELWKKKLGIVGFGNIARGVTRRAQGYQMEIFVFDPYISSEIVDDYGVVSLSLEDMLPQVDFLSLHAPLTEETEAMIAKEQLDLMKSTSYLINTARGGLVNEDDLFNALVAGKIAGAGLDVFIEEPLRDSPLVKLDTVVLTAHTGTHTRESIERMGTMAVENVLRVFRGDDPISRIA